MMITKLWLFVGLANAAGVLSLDEKGTRFVLSFIAPKKSRSLPQAGMTMLSITAEVTTDVIVHLADSHQLRNTVGGGETLNLTLPAPVRYYEWGNKRSQAVLVLAEPNPVAIIVADVWGESASTYLALPVEVLSTNYIGVTYGDANMMGSPVMLVAAVHDNTDVMFQFSIPTGDCNKYQHDESKTISMNSLDVIGFHCSSDFTGTRVTSNKPIVFITGHQELVWGHSHVGDAIQEMLVPVEYFGLSYVLMDTESVRSEVRIVASEKTRIWMSDGDIRDLQSGQFVSLELYTYRCLYSDKPVLVVWFGEFYFSNSGTAFMSVIFPTNMLSGSVKEIPFWREKMIYALVVYEGHDALIENCHGVTYHEAVSDLDLYDLKTKPVGVYVIGKDQSHDSGFAYPLGVKFDGDRCMLQCRRQWDKTGGFQILRCNCFSQPSKIGNNGEPTPSLPNNNGVIISSQVKYPASDPSSTAYPVTMTSSVITSISTATTTTTTSAAATTRSTTTPAAAGNTSRDRSITAVTKLKPTAVQTASSFSSEQQFHEKGSVDLLSETGSWNIISPTEQIPTAASPVVPTEDVLSRLEPTSNQYLSSELSDVMPNGVAPSDLETMMSLADRGGSSEILTGESSVTEHHSLLTMVTNQESESSSNTKNIHTEAQTAARRAQPTTPTGTCSPSSSTDSSHTACHVYCASVQAPISAQGIDIWRIQISKGLLLETSNLSMTRRKRTSAPDDRPSATGVGISGVVLLCLITSAVVLPDVLKLVLYMLCWKSLFSGRHHTSMFQFGKGGKSVCIFSGGLNY